MKNLIIHLYPYQWLKNLLSNQYYFFYISILALLIIYYVKYPSLFLSAEIWAETGTNFLHNAIYLNFLENMQAKDYTYLPWIQRIISVVIIKFFGVSPENFPIFVQIVTQFFIAGLASSINFKIFRSIISSDSLRFFLGLAIGLAPDYEQHTLINFIYFAAVPLLLLSFVNKKDLSLSTYSFLTVFTFLVIMSKAIMIIFIAVFLPFLAYYISQRNTREILYFSIAIVAIILQVIVMKSSGQADVIFTTTEAFVHLTQSTGYTYLRILMTTLFGSSADNLFQIFGYSLPIALFFILMLLILKLKSKLEYSNLFLFLGFAQIFVISHIALMNLTVLNGQAINFNDFSNYSFHRFYFLPKVFMFISVSSLAYIYIKNSILKIVFLSIFALLFSVLPMTKFQDPYSIKKVSFSQWQDYGSLMKGKEYCIPLNPFPWSMNYNCSTLYQNELPITRREIILEPSQEISAVVFIKPTVTPYGYEPSLLLLDHNNTELGRAKRLTNLKNDFVYYKFKTNRLLRNQSSKIIFVDEYHRKLSIHSGLIIYGS